MATQRRRGSQARNRGRPRRGPAPGWLWGLGGLTLGLAVAVAVQLYHTSTEERGSDLSALLDGASGGPAAPTGETAPKASRAAANDDESGHKPRFEFYRLLPEQEVAVPDSGAAEAEARDEPAPPPRPAKQPAAKKKKAPEVARSAAGAEAASGGYLLQAGSFRSFADADRLKATLALLGVEANVSEVELTGGETWHRIRIGPFDDRSTVNEVRRRLSNNDIETILLRRGG